MNARNHVAARAVAALAAVLLGAACGTATTPPTPPRPQASARLPVLTAAEQQQECAALDLVRMGYDTYAAQVAAVAGQYTVSQHDAGRIIAAVIGDRCPAEISVIPAPSPLP